MNTRNARSEVSQNALAVATLLVLLLASAMTSAEWQDPDASWTVDAIAAPPAAASHMPAPDSRATDGNVVDLTY